MKHNNNLYKVYGINGALSIMNSESCIIDKIIISSDFNVKKNSNKKIFEKYRNTIQTLSKDKFKNKYHSSRTQGIVVYFNYKIYNYIPDDDEDRANQCYIILDSIKDPQNLGQILRTSECAGITGVIIPERRSSNITSTVLQVSQGAFCNLNIIVSKNIKYSINEFKENGYWVIGVENSIDSKNWYEMDMKGKNIFVFGSEGEGIRSLIKKYCDYLITIPMLGKINSLNISATVSAILFERNRQILDYE
tara:strand:+ start:331 stop:1077 length:747 start_codon:yes stop_codon:yes gene_type:complete